MFGRCNESSADSYCERLNVPDADYNENVARCEAGNGGTTLPMTAAWFGFSDAGLESAYSILIFSGDAPAKYFFGFVIVVVAATGAANAAAGPILLHCARMLDVRALRADVQTIEHGTYLDDEAIALMKQRSTWLVATILAGRFAAEKTRTVGYFPDIIRPKALAIGPQIQGMFTRAYKAGVNIAFGTDQGVAPHGDNAKEFEYMVEAGMPPLETLRAATLHGAKVMGMESQIGD